MHFKNVIAFVLFFATQKKICLKQQLVNEEIPIIETIKMR